LLFGIWNLDLWVVGDRVEGVGDAKFQVRGDESDDATAMTTTMTQPPKSQKKKEPKAKANKQPFQSTFDHWHWRADTAYSSTSTP